MIIKEIFYNIAGYLRGGAKAGPLWWVVQVTLALLSAFFTVFGFELLMGAYTLKDPFSFIMTFFASNFILFISITLLGIFCWKMYSAFKKSPPHTPKEQ